MRSFSPVRTEQKVNFWNALRCVDRYIHRLTPVAGTCPANIPEIQALLKRVSSAYFAPDVQPKYSVSSAILVLLVGSALTDAIVQDRAEDAEP